MGNQPLKFSLRPAIASDYDFIWELRIVTMKEVISSSYRWDEDTQRSYAAESLDGKIILVENSRVGVITISDWGNQLHLTFLALLPQYQDRGLGSRLIGYAQHQAKINNKPLTLQVLKTNSTKLFYEKHGFKVCDRNGAAKLLMQWQPDNYHRK